jgi:hypothetical protein
MPLDAVVARVTTARPRVAAHLARPHADEMLLAQVVTDLVDIGLAALLGTAFGLSSAVERVVLWGADVMTGTEDLALASALRRLDPEASRAAVLDAEPDLVVVTDSDVALVDATVGRPGHAAARLARGEPVPARHTEAVQASLRGHGALVTTGQVERHFAVARLAAVALLLANEVDRTPYGLALAARPVDLLQPSRDAIGAWTDSAVIIGGMAGIGLRTIRWLDVADRLAGEPRAAAVVRRIRTHPLVVRPRALG